MQDGITYFRNMLFNINLDAFCTGDTGFAHATSDDGRVRCLAAPARQDALRGKKAVNILGPCLFPDQYDLLAGIAELLGEIMGASPCLLGIPAPDQGPLERPHQVRGLELKGVAFTGADLSLASLIDAVLAGLAAVAIVPVIITGRMPASRAVITASLTSGRGGSIML